MQLKDHLSKTFLMLRIDQNAGRALEIIDLFPTWERTHVIVFRPKRKEYYLFHRKKIEQVLLNYPREDLIDNILQLKILEPTPILSLYDSAEEAPDQCVVMDAGHIAGFVDFDQPSGLTRYEDFQNQTSESEEVLKYVGAEFPEKIQLGEEVDLLVSVSEEQGLFTRETKIESREGIMADINVLPDEHFEVIGSKKVSFQISEGAGEEFFKFSLRAIKPGTGEIRIIVFVNDGKQMANRASLTLGAKVYKEKTWVGRENIYERKGMGSPYSSGADLQLFITQYKNASGCEIFVQHLDPSLGSVSKSGSIVFQNDIRVFLRQRFTRIERSFGEEAKELLGLLGVNLFRQLFPEAIQQMIWKIKERIRSIHIISDEPHIPWELCRVVGKNEAGEESFGNFLSEDYEITRWREEYTCRQQLQLTRLAYIAPKDSNLVHAAAEVQFLRELAEEGIKVEHAPAQYLSLRSQLLDDTIQGWHFISHGNASLEEDLDQSSIQLSEEEKLYSEDLSDLTFKSAPLVFLNACQVGRSGMSLTRVGGFAQQFLRAGAGAFIAPLWNVDDKAAFEFAKAFYSELATGATIGRAAKQARFAARKHDETSWLDYTVFAHPQASIK